MRVLFLVAAIQLFVASCYAEDEFPIASLDDIKKLPVVMLKKMLSQRGLECKGCTDKADFIKMAFETQHKPILPPAESSEEEEGRKEDLNKKEVDDIMETLKNGGFGGAKMYTAADLKDMKAEDMAEKFGSPGEGAGKKMKSGRAGKRANKEKKEKKEKAEKKADKKEKKTDKGDKGDRKEKKEKKEKKAEMKPDKKAKKDKKKSRFSSSRPKATATKSSSSVEEEEGDRIEL